MGLSMNLADFPADERPDNKSEVPFSHYKELFAESDPGLMASRTGLPYDEGSQTFHMRFIGRKLAVGWPNCDMRYADDGAELPVYTRIMIARVLLEGSLAPGSGAFVPYAEVGYGQTYLKAFNGRCIARFSHMFASAGDFARCAEAIGGRRVEQGDAAYDVEVFDDVFLRLILWEGDDEFPMSGQILFSDNVAAAFSCEDAAVMCDLVLSALKAAKRA